MIIAVANQRGGVGKTTTAAAITCGLRQANKRVLAIDADPQCSLSFILGADTSGPGLLEFLQGNAPAEKPLDRIIQHTEQADIIPGSKRLAAAAGKIKPDTLRLHLQLLSRKYRYFIIDTGPGLSGSMLQALIAADIVIIPVTADAASLLGLRDMVETVREAERQGTFEKDIHALITQANSRKTNAEKAIEEALRQTCTELGVPLYRQQIRKADAVRAAAGFRESIITYDPNSKPAQDYIALLHEMKLK